MPIDMCPHCYKRYTFDARSGDIIHTCDSGKPVLDQEDITVVGTQAVEFGETVNTGRMTAQINMEGVASKLQGTLAEIEGARLDQFTVRGNRVQTTRTRQHYAYIEAKEAD